MLESAPLKGIKIVMSRSLTALLHLITVATMTGVAGAGWSQATAPATAAAPGGTPAPVLEKLMLTLGARVD